MINGPHQHAIHKELEKRLNEVGIEVTINGAIEWYIKNHEIQSYCYVICTDTELFLRCARTIILKVPLSQPDAFDLVVDRIKWFVKIKDHYTLRSLQYGRL